MDKLRSSISLPTSGLPNLLGRRYPSPPPPTAPSNPKEIIFHSPSNGSSSSSLQSNNDRTSSESSYKLTTSVLRTAVLHDILSSEPDATISEYTLSSTKDLTKPRKFCSSKDLHSDTLVRAAGYGLRKHLAIHTGKERLDERWKDVKSKDVEEHGGDELEFPDTLVVATTYDSRRDSIDSRKTSVDSRSSSGSDLSKRKAVVSRVWSLKKQVCIGEVVWKHVDSL